jgi:predicted aspartyl protease
MELQGRMDENGQMWLTITVRGMRGETTIEAMVDSGFTWALALPVSVAVPLGLELVDFRPAELADGTVKHFFAFAVTVVIGGREFPQFALSRKQELPSSAHCSCNLSAQL